MYSFVSIVVLAAVHVAVEHVQQSSTSAVAVALVVVGDDVLSLVRYVFAPITVDDTFQLVALYLVAVAFRLIPIDSSTRSSFSHR